MFKKLEYIIVINNAYNEGICAEFERNKH